MTRPQSYDCRETLERIDDYVDRELGPGEIALVQEHLARCAVCARGFAFEESVLRKAREKLARIDLPQDVKSRVLEALRRDRG